MIADVIESLASLLEFVIGALAVPSYRGASHPRVGDRVGAARTATVTAVFRPLTPNSDRLHVSIPEASEWRVELALAGEDRAVYLVCIDPLDCLGLTREQHRRALSDGLWLEVPRTLFADTFKPL